MAKRQESITERQQYWLDHIKAADASAGSLVAYAAEQQLRVKDLYQWKTALARRGLLPGKNRRAGFVPVAPVEPVAPTSCSIALPNGVRLQLSGDLDAAMLGQVLAAAHALS